MKMENKNKKLMEQVRIILRKYGQKAFKIAKNFVLQERTLYEPVYEALRYFMEESWLDFQHPALISLTCEAVGGDPNTTTPIGAAFVLLAGAADIHDDIIDKSKIKNSKPTIFGKFGKEIALLAGDALLFKGLILLHKACEKLPHKTKQTILNLTIKAFFELGNAEAKEVNFRAKCGTQPEEYWKIIETKAAVAEASARIGAILGCGNSKEIEALGSYGRIIGILMTIRDDFIDLFESDEIINRAKNECLPLPLLLALQDAPARSEIVYLLGKNKLTEQETQRIVDLVMDNERVQDLKREMTSLVEYGISLLSHLKGDKYNLKLLIEAAVEDL
jgi:geranylgeranyl pyrophosphate synthase